MSQLPTAQQKQDTFATKKAVTIAELAEKVFGTDEIVNKILQNVTAETMHNLHLRLVNKKFNSAALFRVRQEHKKVVINSNCPCPVHNEFRDFEIEINEEKSFPGNVNVQSKTIRFQSLSSYLNFLQVYAEVKVEELGFFVELPIEAPHCSKVVHSHIMKLLSSNQSNVKKLTWINQTCAGCEDCTYYANKCKIYGPISYDVLTNGFKAKHKFDTLIISDDLLMEISRRFNDEKRSRSECVELMKKCVNQKIKCRRLYLKTCARSQKERSVPVELVQEMIRVWEVEHFTVFVNSSRHDFTDLLLQNRADRDFLKLFDSTEGGSRVDFEVPQLELLLTPLQFHGQSDITMTKAWQMFPSKKVVVYRNMLYGVERLDRYIGHFLRNYFDANRYNTVIDIYQKKCKENVRSMKPIDCSQAIASTGRNLTVRFVKEDYDIRYEFEDVNANFSVILHMVPPKSDFITYEE